MVLQEKTKEHNPHQLHRLDHAYSVSVIGGSGSEKANALLNLISHQIYSDKFYLYAKYPFELKYQVLINKLENADLKHCDSFKVFVNYSKDMDNIYENFDEYNANKKCEILIVLDDMILDILNNKTLKSIVTEFSFQGEN